MKGSYRSSRTILKTIPILSTLLLAIPFSNHIYAQSSSVTSFALPSSLSAYIDETPKNKSHFAPTPITIGTRDNSATKLVFSTKVSDILDELGIEYDEDDIISPEINSTITNPFIISIKYINERLQTRYEPIPFEITYTNDPDLEIGKEYVVLEGSEGSLEIIEKYTYQDGEVIEIQEQSRTVVQTPVNKIIARGTKIVFQTVASCEYWDRAIDNATSDPAENAWMKKVMRCESGCNSGRVSSNGKYYGLYQFLPSTFRNFGGTNIFDGYDQISITLSMYRMGKGPYQWPVCGK